MKGKIGITLFIFISIVFIGGNCFSQNGLDKPKKQAIVEGNHFFKKVPQKATVNSEPAKIKSIIVVGTMEQRAVPTSTKKKEPLKKIR